MARTPRKPVTDLELLSSQEQEEIRGRARERVAKERKQKAEDAFLQLAIDEERRALDPQYEVKRLTLDLAGHSDRIMLDGVIYFHGFTYDVPKPVFDTLVDVIARGWEHENEVGGANRDQYRRPRSTALRPGMESMAPSAITTTNRLMGGI